MHTIFVYGTLKQNFGNHRIIEGQNFIGKGTTADSAFKMLDLGAFPGVVDGQGIIHGEIYEVDDNGFTRCDHLEGYPNFYTRRQIEVVAEDGAKHLCWMYMLNRDNNNLEGYPIVHHGVW